MTRSRPETIRMFWRSADTDEQCAATLGIDVEEVKAATAKQQAELETAVMVAVKNRMGIGCTLEETASALGISREWVRRIEAEALKKLRETMKHEDFL